MSDLTRNLIIEVAERELHLALPESYSDETVMGAGGFGLDSIYLMCARRR